MNDFICALIVFIVLLPGFVARKSFHTVGVQTMDFAPLWTKITSSILAAIALQTAWGLGAWLLPIHDSIDLKSLLDLLSISNDRQQAMGTSVMASHSWIALYFGSQLVTAYFLPLLLRQWIARFDLDRKETGIWSWLGRIFRIPNADWYYLLPRGVSTSGPCSRESLANLTVTATVCGRSVTYSGMLYDYMLDREGKLLGLRLIDYAILGTLEPESGHLWLPYSSLSALTANGRTIIFKGHAC